MTTPNMAEIEASLEKSLSLDHRNHDRHEKDGGGCGGSDSSNPSREVVSNISNEALELNSDVSLPHDWEQCLDLKTGEVYYINRETGMKSRDDPRTRNGSLSGDIDSEEDDNDSEYSSYDSDEAPNESSRSSAMQQQQRYSCRSDYKGKAVQVENEEKSPAVLVVVGCQSCFMYFMLPKHEAVCPKCCGGLLRFDRPSDSN